jgi:SAM-dependent methyltransferase
MSKDQSDQSWERVAAGEAPDRVLYLDTFGQVDFVQHSKQQTFALLELAPGAQVLDAGCGTGDDARALAAHVGLDGMVIGVDNDPRMVAEAERRAAGAERNVQFLLGDLHQLELPDASFDACRADRVFQHLADPRQALAELVRIARPAGRIVVSEPDWGTLVIDSVDREVTRRFCHYLCDTVVRNGWIGRQLRGLFLEAGLEDIVVFTGTLSLTSYQMADRLWGAGAEHSPCRCRRGHRGRSGRALAVGAPGHRRSRPVLRCRDWLWRQRTQAGACVNGTSRIGMWVCPLATIAASALSSSASSCISGVVASIRSVLARGEPWQQSSVVSSSARVNVGVKVRSVAQSSSVSWSAHHSSWAYAGGRSGRRGSARRSVSIRSSVFPMTRGSRGCG